MEMPLPSYEAALRTSGGTYPITLHTKFNEFHNLACFPTNTQKEFISHVKMFPACIRWRNCSAESQIFMLSLSARAPL